MNALRLLTLFVLLPLGLGAQPRLIELYLTPQGAATLNEGHPILTGRQLRLGRQEVVLECTPRGKSQPVQLTVARSLIQEIKFPPTAPTPPRPEARSGPTAAGIQAGLSTSGGLSAKLQSSNLQDLNDPEVRAFFQQLQAQMMAPYVGKENYDATLAHQNQLYEQLASGKMSVDQLRAEATKVSDQAREYNANETRGFPELNSWLSVLDNFAQGKSAPAAPTPTPEAP